MTRTLLLVVTLLIGGTRCSSSSAPAIDPNFQLAVQSIVTGLTSPVYLTAPPGDARLFIVDQPGLIRIVKAGQLLATPFLDLSARVAYGGERGLLSMAFDPRPSEDDDDEAIVVAPEMDPPSSSRPAGTPIR